MKEYMVDEPMILIDFLEKKLEKSHKKAKQLLTNRQVIVNDKVETKYNKPLLPGIKVRINNFNTSKMDLKVEIIYEDKDIIVVNKPYNMLTIATESEKEKTLYHLVGDYLKRTNKNAKVFIVHRLDRETSGIVLFAKREEVKEIYQKNWDKVAKFRGYIALVEGKMEKKYGKIEQYLVENENNFKVFIGKKSPDSKKALTFYKVLKTNDKYSLVDIEIKTGRKNQIRVAMQSIGNTIVGDSKYGSKNKSLNRLALHADRLIINNPINNKEMTFKSKYPKEFDILFNKK